MVLPTVSRSRTRRGRGNPPRSPRRVASPAARPGFQANAPRGDRVGLRRTQPARLPERLHPHARADAARAGRTFAPPRKALIPHGNTPRVARKPRRTRKIPRKPAPKARRAPKATPRPKVSTKGTPRPAPVVKAPKVAAAVRPARPEVEEEEGGSP